MDTRTEARSSGYDQMYQIGGKVVKTTVTVGTNVVEAAKTPIRPGAQAYQMHAAGLGFFTSATVIDVFSGNWFRAGVEAAATAYCAVGLLNQIGKQGAINLAKSAPGKIFGLFSQATPAAPKPSAPQEEFIERPKFQ